MQWGAHSSKGTSAWVPALALHGRMLDSRQTPSTSLTFQRERAEHWVAGKHASVVSGGSLGGFPWPRALPCWRAGPCLPLLRPLLFPLSTARKTPHCISASPPRVPRTTLSNTSTRYEPLCDKTLLGHAVFSRILTTEAAETQPRPQQIQHLPF